MHYQPTSTPAFSRAPFRTCAAGLAVVAWLALATAQPSPAAQSRAGDVVSPPAVTAVIRGRVVDAATKGPLRGAMVRASSPALREPRTALTDQAGRFELVGLPAGDFSLVAGKRNYLDQPFGRTRANDPPRAIRLTGGDVFDSATFIVSRGGVIAGTIVDELGEPLDTVVVSVLRYDYTGAGRRLRTIARSRPTNDLGEYRVAGLPAGRYFLAATLPSAADDGVVPAEVLDRTAYAPTFSPGVDDVEDAERIVVRPGDVHLGRTIQLKPVPVVSVRGRAVTDAGLPLHGRRVGAFLEGTGIDSLRSTTVSESGTFLLSGLPTGAYTLRVSDDSAGLSGAARVTLSNFDLDGIDIVASRPATLRGRLRLLQPPARPISPSSFRVRALPSHQQSLADGVATFGNDSTFALTSGAGRALLRIESAFPEWTLEQIRLNGTDVTDSGFEVPASGTVRGLDVIMTNTSPALAIDVVDAEGAPVTDVQVIVFSRERAHWTHGSRHVALARAAPGRRFVARLPAGRYYAIAVDDAEPGEWQDPQFLSSVTPRSVPVEITAGATSSLRLLIAR